MRGSRKEVKGGSGRGDVHVVEDGGAIGLSVRMSRGCGSDIGVQSRANGLRVSFHALVCECERNCRHVRG